MSEVKIKILEQSALVKQLHQSGNEDDLCREAVKLFDMLRDEYDLATEQSDTRTLSFSAPQVCSLAERVAYVRDDWAHKS